MQDRIEKLFFEIAPSVDFFSLRLVEEATESLSIRQNILQPVTSGLDAGIMLTVIHNGGLGYASTSDLTPSGLKEAAERATLWASYCSTQGITDFNKITFPTTESHYETPVKQPWNSTSLSDKLTLLGDVSESMAIDPRIVDWNASLNSGCLECTD